MVMLKRGETDDFDREYTITSMFEDTVSLLHYVQRFNKEGTCCKVREMDDSQLQVVADVVECLWGCYLWDETIATQHWSAPPEIIDAIAVLKRTVEKLLLAFELLEKTADGLVPVFDSIFSVYVDLSDDNSDDPHRVVAHAIIGGKSDTIDLFPDVVQFVGTDHQSVASIMQVLAIFLNHQLLQIRGSATSSDETQPVRKTANRDTANAMAMQFAKEDPEFARTSTAREWARKIGCSPSLVTQLPFWKQCQEKRAAENPTIPKAVSLTDDLASLLGAEDESLERLIKEQQDDDSAGPRRAKA